MKANPHAQEADPRYAIMDRPRLTIPWPHVTSPATVLGRVLAVRTLARVSYLLNFKLWKGGA